MRLPLGLLLLLCLTVSWSQNDVVPLRGGTEMKFVAGMNIAWKDFATDLDPFTYEDEVYFNQIFDSVSMAGGNAVRWWLHTNGRSTPTISSSGYVEGVDFEAIVKMKTILDMAYDHGIVISMCLWSFDMLQNQGQDNQAMISLLENEENIQSYIDNALIPILDMIGDHPAVMTWEIFNEPEGMSTHYGWTNAGKISLETIQIFVNRLAGAIHRNTEQALVSNGSWNFRVMTDVGGFSNLYSDEALIAAGGDEDGYLDFYQIHFYAEHFGNDTSPFHNPASYWELDKPIVVGEFWADEICCRTDPDLTIVEGFEYLINNGYAGAMTWSWTDRPDFGPTSDALKRANELIPEDLHIPSDLDIERMPQRVAGVPPFRMIIEEGVTDTTYTDLADYFIDEEDGTDLTYTTTFVSNESAVDISFVDSEVYLQFANPTAGVVEVTYRATDSQGWYVDQNSAIILGSTVGQENNLLFFKEVSASTTRPERFEFYLNDGDLSSRWEGTNLDHDTVWFDLGEEMEANFS